MDHTPFHETPSTDGPPASSSERLADGAALLGLCAAVTTAHASVLFGSKTFCFEDFFAWYVSARNAVIVALRHGRLAEWDPGSGLGSPLVFNSAPSPLYPLNALQLFGDLQRSLHWFIALHLFLGAAFTYALGRTLGVRRAVALAGGLGFAFSGPMVSYAQENPYQMMSAAWIPLSLVCLVRACRESDLRWTAGGAMATAMILFAGDAQAWLFNGAILGAAALALCAEGGRSGVRRLAPLAHAALTVVGGAVLASSQVWATCTMLGESDRGRGHSEASLVHFSLHPFRLLEWFVPYATGSLLPENSLWGAGLTGNYRNWMASTYLGVLPWLVLPSALARGAVGRRLSAAAVVCIGVFAVLAVGHHTPVFLWASRHVPGMGLFRYPEKWVAAAVVPASIVAMLGLESTLARAARRTLALGVVSITLVGIVTAGSAEALRPLIARVAVRQPPEIVARAIEGLRAHGCVTAALAIAFGAVLVLAHHGRDRAPTRGRIAAWGAAILVAADLIPASFPAIALDDRSEYERAGPLLEAITRRGAHDRFRRDPFLAWFPVPVASGAYQRNIRRSVRSMALYTAAGRARTISIHGPSVIASIGPVLAVTSPERHALGASVFGLRWHIIADRPTPPAWLRIPMQEGRLRVHLIARELSAALLEDTAALPRAFRVARVRVVAGGADARLFEASLAGGHPFGDVALIDADDAMVDGRPGLAPRLAPGEASDDPERSARFVRDEPGVVEVETHGSRAGVLVLNDAYARGWSATVDGVAVPIRRTNFVVRGVDVPAGSSRVRFEYRHPGLRAAIAFNVAAVLVWVMLVLRRPRPERPK